ncbi:hypothetical protein fh0823_19990 [Francisella halioticida]|nr:hypothetical protein fh0823_19990 [Francisella halioticida]
MLNIFDKVIFDLMTKGPSKTTKKGIVPVKTAVIDGLVNFCHQGININGIVASKKDINEYMAKSFLKEFDFSLKK